jgi:hypothetical protein
VECSRNFTGLEKDVEDPSAFFASSELRPFSLNIRGRKCSKVE